MKCMRYIKCEDYYSSIGRTLFECEEYYLGVRPQDQSQFSLGFNKTDRLRYPTTNSQALVLAIITYLVMLLLLQTIKKACENVISILTNFDFNRGFLIHFFRSGIE